MRTHRQKRNPHIGQAGPWCKFMAKCAGREALAWIGQAAALQPVHHGWFAEDQAVRAVREAYQWSRQR